MKLKPLSERPLRRLEAELNKIRGFRDWEKSLYAQDLIKEIDLLKKIPDGKYCKIIGVRARGDDFVDCCGAFHANNNFVKDFKNGNIEYTYNGSEAKMFTDDVEGTKCMRKLIMCGMTHILVWYYDRHNCEAEVMHYPNENWWKCGNLEPLLLHHTVSEYYQNPY